MSPRELPSRPSLAQYRKQAKDLLKALRRGDAAAYTRLRDAHPRLSRMSDDEMARAGLALADAQHALAREHGCASWPKFVQRIAELNGDAAEERAWHAADAAVMAGDAHALERLLREHPRLRNGGRPRSHASEPRPDYASGDARATIVGWHHCASWEACAELFAARRDAGSPIARFEAAADAVVAGDLPALARALAADPGLARARSTRRHRVTLLHYVGANGVEWYRQRSPANAVAIARLLLDAGAEIDATAALYGDGDTTLGLIVTSVHPPRAGALDGLVELFIARGARADRAEREEVVNSCLANGRLRGAQLMAAHGAAMDLEGAAGVGRLDLVRACFAADGRLNAGIPAEKLRRAFAWACEYGHAEVAEFLLQHGVDIAAALPNHGQTGLHWAAHGGHTEIVRRLLARGAPVDAKDATWGTTALSWTLHGWSDPPLGAERASYPTIARMLISAGATVQPEWREREDVVADPGMLGALTERSPGGA